MSVDFFTLRLYRDCYFKALKAPKTIPYRAFQAILSLRVSVEALSPKRSLLSEAEARLLEIYGSFRK